MDQATGTPSSCIRRLAAQLFRAVYAEHLAVREAQAIGLWTVFCFAWAPLMVIGEPFFKFLVSVGINQVYAMFVSLTAYMLPARWLGGRISAYFLERQRRRIAQGRTGQLDGFWGPFLVGVPAAGLVGALFTYLWIELPLIALLASGMYLLSGLAFKLWKTPLRQAVAAGILFGVALPGITIGLWTLGH